MTDAYSAGGYELDVPEPTPAATPEATPEPSPEPPAPEPVSAPSPEPAPATPEAPAPSPTPVANPDEAATPPSEPVTPDPVPPVDPNAPELFELPDGRKVTAAEMREEYLNLLPEFTRKSQRLAALEGGTPPITQPSEEVVPEWKQPGYQAKSVAELVEIATQEAEARILGKQQAEAQALQEVAKHVDDQIAAIKQTDPNLNENLLFQHANKYGFTDLSKAHANMVEMGKIRTETEKTVLQNVRTREADPVAAAPGNPVTNEELDPNETGQYSTALDYLNRTK